MSNPVNSNFFTDGVIDEGVITTNSNLNFIRHYKFTFFDMLGEGPYTYQEIPDVIIMDSVNFSFDYTVTNSILNNATFRFYNLSKATLSLFTSTKNKRGFIFDTWYSNNTAGNVTIFKGLVYSINTYREGPDIITELVAVDILLNLQFGGLQANYPVGVTYLFIVQDLMKKYGDAVSLNVLSNQFLSTQVTKTPQSYRGTLIYVLQKIASDLSLIFSVQQNTFTFIPSNFQIPISNANQTITKDNGLVGYVRAESLAITLLPIGYFNNQQLNKNLSILGLSTLIRPYNLYDKVYLSSEQFQGYFFILSIRHYGEWRGNDWYSRLRLYPDVKSQTGALLA